MKNSARTKILRGVAGIIFCCFIFVCGQMFGSDPMDYSNVVFAVIYAALVAALMVID